MINVEELFDKYENEYLEFDRVENKLASRPDLCAFLILDKLMQNSKQDIISSASHDQIFFNISEEDLSKFATEGDILTLRRCGMSYSEDYLYMFV